MLRIYNSQSRTKEEFKPLDPEGRRVTMYTCGPTVYDSLHLGHARAAIVPDIVRRYLEYKGFQVRYVTNFTDVDDKIIKRALAEGRDWRSLTRVYIAEYHRVMLALGVMPADMYPKATDHLPEMIEMVKRLIEDGHAYATRDGDVYFDTSSYDRYGALARRKLDEEEAGRSGRLDEERIAAKKNPGDFLLWKRNKNDKDELARGGDKVPRWPSPWGEGRPGWHLECSAMSHKYLGVPFDIHAGGQDLIFPHHEDEKAQTECAYHEELGGREAVRYWIHNAFVNVKGAKMSKSLGNTKWLREMIRPEGPHDPMAVRMMLLSSHYRSPIVFEPEMLDEASARLERIYNALEEVARASCPHGRTAGRMPALQTATAGGMPALQTATAKVDAGPSGEMAAVREKARADFDEAMDDDFNTAGALAVIFSLVSRINVSLAEAAERRSPAMLSGLRVMEQTIRERLGVLGLRPHRGTGEGSGAGGDSEKLVALLLKTRQEARAAKQFALADQVRDGLAALGYEIQDRPGGQSDARTK